MLFSDIDGDYAAVASQSFQEVKRSPSIVDSKGTKKMLSTKEEVYYNRG